MDLKSSKKDVELPLLSKSNKRKHSNEQSFIDHSQKESQTQRKTYFNVDFFNRLIFGWANDFIYVIYSYQITFSSFSRVPLGKHSNRKTIMA